MGVFEAAELSYEWVQMWILTKVSDWNINTGSALKPPTYALIVQTQ